MRRSLLLLLLAPLLMAPDVGIYEQHYDLKNVDAASDAVDVQILYEVKDTTPPPTGNSVTTPQGITFVFGATYQTGTYLDGQPWVVETTPGAGVVINAMTPDFASGRNGWFENKRAFKQINYGQNGCTATGNCSLNTLDSRMETGTSNNGYAYVAPTTYYGPLPRTIPAGTSVTKVRSVGSASYCVPGDDTNCIQDISVLTVLAAPPPPNSMRPPLGGPSTQKPHFVLTGFDLATGIPNLPLLGTGAQYSWGQVNASIYNYPPFVSTFIPGEFDGRWIPNGMIKLNGQPSINYGCDTGYWLNGVILRLSQTGTVAEKQKAFYYLLNAAIDHYYAEVDGKDWGSTGCIHHGRKSLIMWGGKILNSIAANQGRAAAMAAYDGGSEAIDLATYTSSTIGEALWGYAANYGSETDPDGRRCDSTQAGISNATVAQCDGLRDGGNFKFGDPASGSPCGTKSTSVPQPTIAFQRANNCIAQTAYQGMSDLYWGACAVARIYGFVQEWTAARADNDPAWIGYCDRFHSPPWLTKDSCMADHCDDYHNEMFKMYGCNSAACITARGGVND